MKKLENCIVDNCIPTPSSCIFWNGGDIEYLGLCNGTSINNVIWEIINKLKDITGEDLSSFDIDSLLDICNQKAPLEINLISILTLLKNNQVCLKDYIDTLSEIVSDLQKSGNVNVNLRCFADIDNLGNILGITRDAFDQLVIDNLCNHKQRIESIEAQIILIKSELANIDLNVTVDELDIATCVDPIAKPTSVQVVTLASDHCALQSATGTPAKISQALAKVPGDWNTKFGLIAGWNLTPAQWADNFGNLLLVVAKLVGDVQTIQDTCCAVTCDDVKVGFSAVMNEDFDGVILRFTNGAGTSIPIGFTDSGSTVTITDVDGNTAEANITITNNAEEEVLITGLNTAGDLEINVTVKMSNGSIQCEKCVFRMVKLPGCNFCTITASDTVTIVYQTCTIS